MEIANRDLMTQARSLLQGKWKPAVIVALVYIVVQVLAGSIPKISGIINLIIGGPMTFGITFYFLSFTRGGSPVTEDLLKGFSVFGKTFVAYLLIIIFVVLWALLLIIPGIIAGLSYSMTIFILIDNPSMQGIDAIRKSKELMNGHKYRYFCFLCRFLGWFILSILTCGIGFLWLIPYFMTSNALFYDNLIKSNVAQVNRQ